MKKNLLLIAGICALLGILGCKTNVENENTFECTFIEIDQNMFYCFAPGEDSHLTGYRGAYDDREYECYLTDDEADTHKCILLSVFSTLYFEEIKDTPLYYKDVNNKRYYSNTSEDGYSLQNGTCTFYKLMEYDKTKKVYEYNEDSSLLVFDDPVKIAYCKDEAQTGSRKTVKCTKQTGTVWQKNYAGKMIPFEYIGYFTLDGKKYYLSSEDVF